MAGALEAFLDVCRAEGSVGVELRPGGAVFELRWHQPGGTSGTRPA
jgi:hypothetical protein